MPAMNKTQRSHMMRKLRKMANDAIEKRFAKVLDIDELNERDDDDRSDSPSRLNSSWTVAQLILAIKSGTVVARPDAAKKLIEDCYGGPERLFVPAKGLKVLEREVAAAKEKSDAREALDQALEAVEDRLIFEDVAGVNSIIEGFELTIKRALTSRK